MAPLSPRPKAGLHNHAGLGQRPPVAAMRSDGAPCRGFVIFVTVHVLETPLHGRVLGWTAFVVMIAGLVITAMPLLGDQAAVLFTFYPPMWAQAAF